MHRGMDYEQLWNRRAPHFETDYSGYDLDVSFLRPYVEEAGALCELGCGTLRLARLLDGAYEKYVGVDLSTEMLETGEQTLTAEIRDRVRLIHAPMQEFELAHPVPLIVNTGNSFLMLNHQEKRETLRRVADQLTAEGRFLLEIYNPDRWRKKPQDQILHLRTIHEPDRDRTVTLTYTQSLDEDAQINRIIWFRDEVDLSTRRPTRDVFPIEFHYLESGQVEDLLTPHFEIEERFGGYDRREMDRDARRFIYVARPR